MNIENLSKNLSGRTPAILGNEKFSKYAVLLPLIEKEDGIHILFEVRSLQMRRQPGEICFPGGRIDKSDKNEEYTAIRETVEELGIRESDVTAISHLDYMITPFGTIIYPFVGIIQNPENINPNRAEVEAVFTVPLAFFKEVKPDIFMVNFKVEPEKDFPFNSIVGGESYNWQTKKMEECFYYYEDKVIWGMTARILQHFLEIGFKE